MTGLNIDIPKVPQNVRIESSYIRTLMLAINALIDADADIEAYVNALPTTQPTIPPAPIILSTTTGINAKTVANTLLYTVPAGKNCYITGYIVSVTAATAITVGASAGIGNTAGANIVSASQAMTSLKATDDTFVWAISGASKATAAGSNIIFNLGTPATGTSQTLTVTLLGYIA